MRQEEPLRGSAGPSLSTGSESTAQSVLVRPFEALISTNQASKSFVLLVPVYSVSTSWALLSELHSR